MSTYREERRADRLAEAQIAREQAAAAAQVRIAERAAAAQQRRLDEQARTEERDRRAEQRRARWETRTKAVRAWVAARAVDLLIYPAVLIAFAMSAPSMGGFGRDVYGSDLGRLLPGISELLMLAFAVAVLLSRRRHPDRPVWGLQAGVWVFAAVSAGSNFLHGVARGWTAGTVMAVVAVSGIVAHQLALATPPRSRTERAAARIERQAARKITRVRRAAVRQAVADLDEHGQAHLVHRPGRFVLQRTGVRWTLTEAVIPASPVPVPELGAELADEVTAWLAEQAETRPGSGSGIHPGTAQTARNNSGSHDPRVPELVARVRAAIAAGTLPETPSRSEVRRFLKVRTAVAGEVVKALGDDGLGGVPAA